MDRQIADVMIHIDLTLSVDSMRQIEEVVRESVCVSMQAVNRRLMMPVAHNPGCLFASDILARDRDVEVHAELVGMWTRMGVNRIAEPSGLFPFSGIRGGGGSGFRSILFTHSERAAVYAWRRISYVKPQPCA